MSELGDPGARAAELGVRFAVAAAVIVSSVGLSRLTSPLVRQVVARRGRPSRTRVFTTLYRVLVVILTRVHRADGNPGLRGCGGGGGQRDGGRLRVGGSVKR